MPFVPFSPLVYRQCIIPQRLICVIVVQDLTITITSERVDSELEFLKDERDECAVNSDAFSSAQEWKLHEKVNVWTKTNVKKVNKKKMKYPCFCVAAKVARRPQFFIYNIIIIMVSAMGVISKLLSLMRF